MKLFTKVMNFQSIKEEKINQHKSQKRKIFGKMYFLGIHNTHQAETRRPN